MRNPVGGARIKLAAKEDGELLALTDDGLLESTDGARTWNARAGAPPVLLVASQPMGVTWGVSSDGSVFRDGDESGWRRLGSVAGRPEAFVATADRLFAATDQGIFESTDGASRLAIYASPEGPMRFTARRRPPFVVIQREFGCAPAALCLCGPPRLTSHRGCGPLTGPHEHQHCCCRDRPGGAQSERGRVPDGVPQYAGESAGKEDEQAGEHAIRAEDALPGRGGARAPTSPFSQIPRRVPPVLSPTQPRSA